MNSKMNAALVVQGDTKSTIAAYDDALLSQALLFASALQTAKVIEMPICESQKLWLTFHRGAGGVLEGRQALQESIAQMQAIARRTGLRSEEHTSELQSLMRISYAVFCLKKKKN